MNKFIFTAFCCLSLSISWGQITIEANTLPEVGDILEYLLIEGETHMPVYSQDGENLRWEFDNIEFLSTDILEERYQDIRDTDLDTVYPEADMLIDLNGFQAAAIRTMNSIEVIGASGNGFGGGGGGGFPIPDINANPRFDDPFVYRQTPINYGDAFEDAFSVSFTIGTDSLAFLDSIPLPIPGATLDSIRFTISNSKSEAATGWGTVSIASEEYEVLKTETTEVSETGLEIGLNFFGIFSWLDASAFFDIGMFIPQGEMVTHRFLAADSKESIIEFRESIIEDSLGIEVTVDARIKNNIISSTENIEDVRTYLVLYPQPCSDMLNIYSHNPKSDQINMALLNSQGQIMDQWKMQGNYYQKDMTAFPNGTYFLMRNDGGQLHIEKVSLIR